MKIDPYNHKERYLSWKEKTQDRISDVSKENSDLIKQYFSDMDQVMNKLMQDQEVLTIIQRKLQEMKNV